MSDPFTQAGYNSGLYGNSLYGGLFSLGGGQQPAAEMTLDDLYKQAQIDWFKQQPGLEQQKLDLMAQSNKTSPWATGAQTFGSIAQGLAGLGSIYLGWQGLKEQKKEFKFNKEVMNTNLNNSILDYNRRLTDTLNNRALNNGGGQAWVSSEMNKWQAKRSGG